MKQLVILLGAMFFASINCDAREKLIIAGSYCDTIVIVDKQTKAVEWAMALPFTSTQGGECNSVQMVGTDKVLFAYKKGARLVTLQGDVVWDFPRENDSQELHTAIQTPDGFMLGLCGSPAKFIFLDKQGRKVSETTYDTAIPDIHSQFRQTRLASNGNILIPMMGNGKLVEIDAKGTKVNEFAIGSGPYSVEELPRAKLLVSGGDGVKEYSRSRGMMMKLIVRDTLVGVKFAFPTQSLRLPGGNTLLTNWQGHDANTQPQIVEVNSQSEIVWMYDDKKAMKYVSAIDFFDDQPTNTKK